MNRARSRPRPGAATVWIVAGAFVFAVVSTDAGDRHGVAPDARAESQGAAPPDAGLSAVSPDAEKPAVARDAELPAVARDAEKPAVVPHAGLGSLQEPEPDPVSIHLPLVVRGADLAALPAPPTAPPRTAAPTLAATPSPTPTPSPPLTPSLTPGATSATPASPTPAVSATPAPDPLPTTPLPAGCAAPLENGDFEARGGFGWIEQTEPGESLIVAAAARTGRLGARIGAWDGGEEVLLSETAVPIEESEERIVTLRWWMRVASDEPIDGHVGDRLLVALVGDVPEAVELVRTYDEEEWPPEGSVIGPDGWAEIVLDLTVAFVWSDDFTTASVAFVSVPDSDEAKTIFDLDDVRLEICPPDDPLASRALSHTVSSYP